MVNIDPVQDLHGQESPYPAGGGNNLFNGTFLQGYWAYADGGLVNSNGWIATEKIPCKPSTSYTASADAKPTRWQGFVWYDANGDYISTDNLQSNVNIGLTKTSPSTAAYLIFNIAGYPNSTDTIAPPDVTHFQLEEGQTATSYAPYENICPISGWTEVSVNHSDADMTNPTTITIQLGQTVYGGKLDVLTGELVIDKGYLLKNTANMDNSEDYPGWNASGIRGLIGGGINGRVFGAFTNITPASAYGGSGGVGANTNGETGNTLMLFREYFGKSQTEWQALAIDVQLVIPLATPITIQLTPNQLNSLYGVNNIWADSGDTEVVYRADTKLYISKKIAEAISALS